MSAIRWRMGRVLSLRLLPMTKKVPLAPYRSKRSRTWSVYSVGPSSKVRAIMGRSGSKVGAGVGVGSGVGVGDGVGVGEGSGVTVGPGVRAATARFRVGPTVAAGAVGQGVGAGSRATTSPRQPSSSPRANRMQKTRFMGIGYHVFAKK